MKILYLDCFAGVSGDLMLGALLDAGVGLDSLQNEIEKLGLHPRPKIELSRAIKCGISAASVTVSVPDVHHHHRHLEDIERIINQSSLSTRVKGTAVRIFRKLAEAEAAVHGCSTEEVHFHEVGAVDAIVDIVGTVVCLDALGVERTVVSPLPSFTGTVTCAHGVLPLPAPATLALLKGIPFRACGIEKELVTPTGAAIVSVIADSFGPMPAMIAGKIGYGAGSWDLEIPNVLRAILGDEVVDGNVNQVAVIETNVDDMNPQDFERVYEVLLDAGALDVFVQNAQMKKNRPGFLLTVLCEESDVERMSRLIFNETTTIGVRWHRAERFCLTRTFESIETAYGAIRMKICAAEGIRPHVQPEYEDCLQRAREMNVPVKEVREAALAGYRRMKSRG